MHLDKLLQLHNFFSLIYYLLPAARDREKTTNLKEIWKSIKSYGRLAKYLIGT